MKPGTLLHTAGVFLSSITSIFSHSAQAKAGEIKENTKNAKKLRPAQSRLVEDQTSGFTPPLQPDPSARAADRYPWKKEIVTTVFWIGEKPSKNNPVPNHKSSWDPNWAE